MFVQRLILSFATSRIARQIIRYPKLWTRNGVEWEALRLLSNDKKPSNHRPKPSMIKHEVKKPSTNGNSNKSAVNNILHYLSAIKSAEGKEKIDLRASLDKQLQTTANYEIFLKEDEIISILQIISEANFYTTFYKGSKAFVKRLVFEISSPNSSFQDRVKLEILSLISRLRYNYIDLHPKDQLALRDVILGIKLTSVTKSFTQYADFFFLMASMTILWRDLPEQYRRLLLSSIKDLGEVDRFPLVSAERFIYSIDKLMIMKFHREDMDVEVKQRYERLLERILQEKYKDDIVTENELQIAAVVMSHLSALAVDRGQKGLGQQQMELVCKGLLKEWKDMRLFDQCNTISMLGGVALDFTTLPEELRKHMMENLGSKVDEFGLKAGGLLCLLKGFVGMRLTWTEMDKSLQGAMIKEVKKLFGKKEYQAIMETTLLLDRLKIPENDGFSLKSHFYQFLQKNSAKFTSKETVESLLLLMKMEISWKWIPKDVRNKIVSMIVENNRDMTAENIANMFYSLGKMKASMEDFSTKRRKLESSMWKMTKLNSTSHGLVNFFQGVSLMGFHREKLNADLQQLLAGMLVSSSSKFNDKELCEMMSILRTMLDDAETTLEKSSFAPVHCALIERYLELMKEKKFSEDEKQVETFIEWVHGSIAEVERTSLHEPLKVVEEP